MRYYVILQLVINLAPLGSCWQFFTSLSDYTLVNSIPDPMHVHSEYRYGHCERKDKAFYAHTHLDHFDVLGKVIVRFCGKVQYNIPLSYEYAGQIGSLASISNTAVGWLDINRIPTCIILRGMAYEIDLFRSTAYNFQICVPRITYCHSRRRFKYYYYEWYISPDLIGGMNWDLYFYGPPSAEWQ